MDSKKVIEKLVKIAEKQQKILEKLAQMPVAPSQDPNVAYLQQAFQVAALNSGVTQVAAPKVTVNPASASGASGNVQMDTTYTVTASGVPQDNAVRQRLMNTFKTQVKTQNPDLDGKVSMVFA